ncbi:unannotated protein [freshwater metagenome]|uniref:Unannotated protein n=1 Tax=freshwater metagenome TaxID=449393 RepID=A0A6J5YWS7_9ZZZZ|nr:PLDc N-terminal domain-containing protein [Actinomycetota bacterium]MSV63704.1 hypothetical protein [Actinomycetota bacterium]MSW25763.1 hypothetical protein [Actinomycetota bacterium]MSW33495.1 hypothetical protein [Actinomycetota bacterium]MSX30519.1 hypothetical protein [Actinomycetota bacterium]
MLRGLLIVLPIIFQIYTLVDCAKTDTSQIRNLPKWGWILLIVVFSTIGSIAFWIAGRPRRTGKNRRPQRRILPPDDDPDFLRQL